jgi:hypothetical protein
MLLLVKYLLVIKYDIRKLLGLYNTTKSTVLYFYFNQSICITENIYEIIAQ